MKIALQDIIKRVCRIPIDEETLNGLFIKSDLDLVVDMGFDSFLMVQLIVEIEDELDIEFDMETLDMEDMRRFEKLVKLVGSMV